MCSGVLLISSWWLFILRLLLAPQQIWLAELVTGSGRTNNWVRLAVVDQFKSHRHPNCTTFVVVVFYILVELD